MARVHIVDGDLERRARLAGMCRDAGLTVDDDDVSDRASTHAPDVLVYPCTTLSAQDHAELLAWRKRYPQTRIILVSAEVPTGTPDPFPWDHVVGFPIEAQALREAVAPRFSPSRRPTSRRALPAAPPPPRLDHLVPAPVPPANVLASVGTVAATPKPSAASAAPPPWDVAGAAPVPLPTPQMPDAPATPPAPTMLKPTPPSIHPAPTLEIQDPELTIDIDASPEANPQADAAPMTEAAPKGSATGSEPSFPSPEEATLGPAIEVDLGAANREPTPVLETDRPAGPPTPHLEDAPALTETAAEPDLATVEISPGETTPEAAISTPCPGTVAAPEPLPNRPKLESATNTLPVAAVANASAVSEADEPDFDTPEADMPAGGPDIDAPEDDMPDIDGPDIDALEDDMPDIDGPDIDAPEDDMPDVDGPEADVPDIDVSEAEVPNVDVLESPVPRTVAAPEPQQEPWGSLPDLPETSSPGPESAHEASSNGGEPPPVEIEADPWDTLPELPEGLQTAPVPESPSALAPDTYLPSLETAPTPSEWVVDASAESATEPLRLPTWGTLNETAPARLLYELWRVRFEGVVELTSQGVGRQVVFQEGTPVQVLSRQRTDALGSMLVAQGWLSEPALQRTRLLSEGRKLSFTNAVVESGAMKRADLEEAQAEHTQRLLVAVFGWPEGAYQLDSAPAITADAHSRESPLRIIWRGVHEHYDLRRLMSYFEPLMDRFLHGTDRTLAQWSILEADLADHGVRSWLDGRTTLRHALSSQPNRRADLAQALYVLLETETLVARPEPGEAVELPIALARTSAPPPKRPKSPGERAYAEGRTRLEKGHAQAARTHFQEAIRHKRQEPAYHVALAEAILEDNQEPEPTRNRLALMALDEALQLNPNHAEANFHYARVLLALGRVPTARACLERVLKQAPDHAQARALLEPLGP